MENVENLWIRWSMDWFSREKRTGLSKPYNKNRKTYGKMP